MAACACRPCLPRSVLPPDLCSASQPDDAAGRRIHLPRAVDEEMSVPYDGSAELVSPCFGGVPRSARASCPKILQGRCSRPRAPRLAAEVGKRLRVQWKAQVRFVVRCQQDGPATFLPDAKSMEDVYDKLAEQLVDKARHLVALAGPPGAGKSTVAEEIVCRVNRMWCQSLAPEEQGVAQDVAIMVPMDGFHLYRWQLDCMTVLHKSLDLTGPDSTCRILKKLMPDEECWPSHLFLNNAMVHRNFVHEAPWTFDADALYRCLARICNKGSGYVPSFNHGVGDPVERDIYVASHHKLLLVEGNYLLLGSGEWEPLQTLFNERWYIDVDVDVAMERVRKRHISTGKTPHIAEWRVLYNDRPNAVLIQESRKNADLVVQSIDNQI
eukprot:SM000282S10609  [mRNA]  locus=s282:60251:63697:- [translate_table: standard]